jgi:hypothetical protein
MTRRGRGFAAFAAFAAAAAICGSIADFSALEVRISQAASVHKFATLHDAC